MLSNKKKFVNKIKLTVFILCSLFSLQAFAQAEVVDHSQTNPQTKAEILQLAKQYLNNADDSKPPKSQEYQLMAAELFIKAGSLTQAEALLNSFEGKSLSTNIRTLVQISQAEILLAKKQPSESLNLLSEIQSTPYLSKSTQLRLLQSKAQIYNATGDYIQSAISRIQLERFLSSDDNILNNRRAIFQDLTNSSAEQLYQYSATSDIQVKGWLTLASYHKRFGNDQEQLIKSLKRWLEEYPSHPAKSLLPKSIQEKPKYGYRQRAAGFFSRSPVAHPDTPTQVALLLPLTGNHAKAAKAIQEGFLASFYEAEYQIQKPSIRIYDTTKENSIQTAYFKAVRDGANFVVGPLIKEEVLDLSQLPSYMLKTPVIALNFHPQVKNPVDYFVQFALSPEGEAEQIAQRAWQSGYRTATIVVPQNSWGKRTSLAFSQYWKLLGGKIVSSSYIDPLQDQAAAIRELLDIDDSQKRASAIKNLLKEKVEFQPRRRQDIDVVIMAAPPEQARQLRPLFDFYYASDLPILATSSIYTGHPNPKKDRDMNGIIFCDMPWLLTDDSGQRVRELLKKYKQVDIEQYGRLFAMGMDAYELTNKLVRLQSRPYARYQGVTGTLSIGANNKVERKLSWAKINDGVPVVIE